MNFKETLTKTVGISESLNFGYKSPATGKKKNKYSNETENSSKYVPVSALTKNTHESLFVCRSAGQTRTKLYWCRREDYFTAVTLFLSVLIHPTCQQSGLALSFGSTHRASQRCSSEPRVQSAATNKGKGCTYQIL